MKFYKEIRRLIQNFNHLLSTYPNTTNAVVFATFCAAAECTQQVLSQFLMSQKVENLDLAAISRYSFCATFTQGAPLTYWYKWLDSKYVGTTFTIISKKLAWDMGFLNPILLAVFFIGMSILEGDRKAIESCKTKLMPTVAVSSIFWVPAQAFNFMFISPAFRVVYIGACSFAWVNILCYINRINFHDYYYHNY